MEYLCTHTSFRLIMAQLHLLTPQEPNAQQSHHGFHKRVLAWYAENQRILPWRTPYDPQVPETTHDPYAVWISEIMLQQTVVSTVVPYYQRFMTAFPHVNILAQAQEEEVLFHWQGLGYYRRARHLHAAAKIIALRGMPTTYEGWRELPGIGPYSAAAIMAISWQKPYAAVDGNIRRIMARQGAFFSETWEKDSEILAQRLMVPQRCSEYTQALMDLANALCRPKEPRCAQCPVANSCLSFNGPKSLRKKSSAGVKPHRYGDALLVTHDVRGKPWVILSQQNTALLKGLWGFPLSAWRTDPDTSPLKNQLSFTWIGGISHVFTHFHAHVDLWHSTNTHLDLHTQVNTPCNAVGGPEVAHEPDLALENFLRTMLASGIWHAWRALESLPCSTLMRKLERLGQDALG